jgi:CBS-domain-containing membrane protein
MTADVTTAAPDDDLRTAARTILEAHHKRLPVVEHGRVVGVVSRHDLIKPFGRADADIAADVERILTSPLLAPEDHQCRAAVQAGVVTLTGATRWPSDARVLVSMIDGVPGVVEVVDELVAREREPHVARA